eukprot:g20953.t1
MPKCDAIAKCWDLSYGTRFPSFPFILTGPLLAAEGLNMSSVLSSPTKRDEVQGNSSVLERAQDSDNNENAPPEQRARPSKPLPRRSAKMQPSPSSTPQTSPSLARASSVSPTVASVARPSSKPPIPRRPSIAHASPQVSYRKQNSKVTQSIAAKMGVATPSMASRVKRVSTPPNTNSPKQISPALKRDGRSYASVVTATSPQQGNVVPSRPAPARPQSRHSSPVQAQATSSKTPAQGNTASSQTPSLGATSPSRSTPARIPIQEKKVGDPRERILEEILTTERRYCAGLKTVVEKYFLPIQKAHYLSPAQLHEVFSNSQQLLLFHQQFLLDLEKLVQAGDEAHNSQGKAAISVGALFLEVVPFFKIYYEYVNNLPNSQEKLTLHARRNKKLDLYLREQELELRAAAEAEKASTIGPGAPSSVVMGISAEDRNEWLRSATGSGQGFPQLQALLITPVQRIPRYMLLLKSLFKHTSESHPDYALLSKALAAVQQATANINEGGNIDLEEESKTNAQNMLRIHRELRGTYELMNAPHRVFEFELKCNVTDVTVLRREVLANLGLLGEGGLGPLDLHAVPNANERPNERNYLNRSESSNLNSSFSISMFSPESTPAAELTSPRYPDTTPSSRATSPTLELLSPNTASAPPADRKIFWGADDKDKTSSKRPSSFRSLLRSGSSSRNMVAATNEPHTTSSLGVLPTKTGTKTITPLQTLKRIPAKVYGFNDIVLLAEKTRSIKGKGSSGTMGKKWCRFYCEVALADVVITNAPSLMRQNVAINFNEPQGAFFRIHSNDGDPNAYFNEVLEEDQKRYPSFDMLFSTSTIEQCAESVALLKTLQARVVAQKQGTAPKTVSTKDNGQFEDVSKPEALTLTLLNNQEQRDIAAISKGEHSGEDAETQSKQPRSAPLDDRLSLSLSKAIQNSDSDMVLALVKSQGNLSVLHRVLSVTERKDNIFTLAARLGRQEVLQRLHQEPELTVHVKAVVNTAKDDGATSLYIACQEGHLLLAQWLVKTAGACLNQRQEDEEGAVALHSACWNGHLPVAQWLVQQGALVNQTTKRGWTPLYIASRGGHVAMVRWLVTEGKAQVDAIAGMASPLTIACQNGHYQVAKCLVQDGGANVNLAAGDGRSPLHIACENQHASLAQWLIKHGAEVNLLTKKGEATPLFLAARKGLVDLVRTMLKAGARVDQAAGDGRTPLYVACQKGHALVVQCLAKEGRAELDRTNSDGRTPLFVAAENGNEDVVRFLVGESGVNINQARPGGGSTPLFMACSKGHLVVAQCLLEAKAAVNQARTKQGWTPLRAAMKAGDMRLVALLIAFGGRVLSLPSTLMDPSCPSDACKLARSALEVLIQETELKETVSALRGTQLPKLVKGLVAAYAQSFGWEETAHKLLLPHSIKNHLASPASEGPTDSPTNSPDSSQTPAFKTAVKAFSRTGTFSSHRHNLMHKTASTCNDSTVEPGLSSPSFGLRPPCKSENLAG